MKIRKHIISLLFVSVLFSGLVVFTPKVYGQQTNQPPPSQNQLPAQPPPSQNQPPTQSPPSQNQQPPIKLSNPLRVNSIEQLLNLILEIVIIFATPVIVFMIMYAGFKFVTAQGKPDALKDARNALLYAVIGGVIILGAKVLLTVLTGTITTLTP